MKKIVLFIIFGFELIYAQTGIGTTTPHASAKLHVSATDKGFLPPRVTLTSVTDATTIPNPAEGLLVYNLGSMGLQAGYYYWNGANWATIATGTTAGNAVVTRDLVKLYHEAYSTSAGKASSTDGFSFTVPVSGRYEFNFNSTAWNSNGSKVKLTFNIRQGTTNILASDYHESTSSNVWAEYEGRVEVNLNSGITYNVQIVTTTGQRDNRDFDKIFYKMVAGNLPVNQHMAERNIQLNNNFLSNDGDNEGIRIDNSGNVGIGTATPTSRLNIAGGGVKLATGFGNSTNRPSLNTSSIGNYEIRGVGSITGTAQNDSADDGFLRLSAGGGTGVSSQSSIDISGFSTVPDMSNNIVMRTGGTERLRIDPSGNVNITGRLNIGDPTGNVSTKLVGRVTAGTFLTFENLRFSVTTTGQRGLSIATVSGAVNLYVEGKYNNGASYGTRTDSPITYTTTPSASPFGWGFLTAGDTIVYHLTDADNSRMYRVTLIIMPSYINNFIAIERLL
ncbi:emp24/gp25L/p24 family protein [Flavobacterium ammonificans]|uniref:C1q domain-containing protein n=1 Tax=Flavobacterium ammonificans TaxID=1751056 RepID=A0ABN6KSS8_9FLAO|nr:emp24/gp25L/p24 family protein [Flavobacterium ammonificans]BDB52194.1 hypothetical protein GENT11_05060 [Flavobacterium ammonificans]